VRTVVEYLSHWRYDNSRAVRVVVVAWCSQSGLYCGCTLGCISTRTFKIHTQKFVSKRAQFI